jgi:hypothetical protein
MTFAKAGLLSAGFIAMFSLGVVSSSAVREGWSHMTAPGAHVAAPAADTHAEAPAKSELAARPAARTRSTASRRAEAANDAASGVRSVPVGLWDSAMRDRVKDVLNPGARLEIAAADFPDGEQFMTVAHAARDTQVPFMVLKDRVLNQQKSLADAIHEFKPGVDAKAAVARARAEARADLGLAG